MIRKVQCERALSNVRASQGETMKPKKKPTELNLADLVRYFDEYGWDLHIQLVPVKKSAAKKRAAKRSR